MTLNHEFVEYIPDELNDKTVYISVRHRTVIHKCVCGCGIEVVTPISPTDWQLTFDGQTISLFPSIGNWNYPCRSHYWIKKSKVVWAEEWSTERINAARGRDARLKTDYYASKQSADKSEQSNAESKIEIRSKGKAEQMWQTIRKLWQ
jgi:hypothetical protein